MNNEDFEEILEYAKSNEQVVGLILCGSRGKGFETENSDYDILLIVKDDSYEEVSKLYNSKKLDNIDLDIKSLSEFKKYADFGTAQEWDRYDFAHVKILVDKLGVLPQLTQDKGYIPENKQKKIVEGYIDGYINEVFRFAKFTKKGNEFGARLHATNSVFTLLSLIFALNGRHAPFLGYLEQELKVYPLIKLPWAIDEFVEKIKLILDSADLKTIQEIFLKIEELCIEEGYKHMIDGWEGKDKLILDL